MGILNLDNSPVDYILFKSMLDALRHRGPDDDEGYLFINTRTNTYQTISGEDTPVSVFTSQFPYTPSHKLGDPDASSGESYNLALGNRRLAIIDLSPAGHQPMCNEDGTLWIVHNGEIYNFRELRQEP